MPTISHFYGISIGMFYNDHAPPHFHAVYAEYEAEFSLDTLDVLREDIFRAALRTWCESGPGCTWKS